MKQPVSNDVRDRLRFRDFLGLYIGLILGSVALAIGIERLTGLAGERSAFLVAGAVFGLAALGWPWWLSATVRTTGWFADLPNSGLTWLLGALAIGAVWAALFAA